MKRNINLQLLRGIAALLAFLLHFMLVERKIEPDSPMMGHAAWLGSIAVDLFFALSGFIMVSISRGRFKATYEWPRFLLERFARIYPAYWLFSLPVLAIYLANPLAVNRAQGNQVDLVASLLLLPQPFLPLLAVGWTLVHEVYFYLVFSCLIGWLPEKKLAWGLAAWGGITVIVDLLFAGRGSSWIDLVSNPLTLEFIAGAFAAMLVQGRSRRFAVFSIGFAFVWLAVALMVIPVSLQAIFPHPWTRASLCAVPCALITMGAAILDTTDARPWRLAIAWVGDRSYSFYLAHVLVINVVAKFWSLAVQPGLWDNLAACVISFACCLAVSAVSFRWVEMPAMKWVKRWLSNRMPRSAPIVQPINSTVQP